MSKRQRPYEGAKTPLKGALTVDDSQESLAIRMLVDQMQSYQQQVMLELQAMNAVLHNQTEQVKAVQLEIAAVKREAAAGLSETRLKMQKLMEQKPTDPATLQAMVKSAQENAHKQMREAETRFKLALQTMPRGDLDLRDEPRTGEVIRLIANGITQFLTPGEINHNVPQTFIDHWEQRKDQKRWAAGINDAFLARTTEGDFFGAGYYNNLLAAANDEKPTPITEVE